MRSCSPPSPWLAGLLLIAACDPGDKDPGGDGGSTWTDGGTPDGGTTARALALRLDAAPPAEATTGEVLPVLVVSLVDADTGALVTDLTAEIRATLPGGTLSGDTTAVLVDGQATFDDLAIAGCSDLGLELSTELPGVAPLATDPVAVRPLLALLDAPGPALAAGALPPVVLALTDAAGDPVELELSLDDSGSVGASLGGDTTASTTEGVANFDALSVTGTGTLALTLTGPAGCPLAEALPDSLVGEEVALRPVFLPAARVGEDYAAALPGEEALVRDPPAGLAATGGWLTGVPEESGAVLLRGAAWDEGELLDLHIRLPLLPADDADLPAPTLDPAEDGPYPTGAVELTVPEITTSRGTTRNVAVRLAFPSDGAGDIAEGRFPVVAFHHAAHSPTDIYDDYTDLHAHWASHGVLVASVDSSVNVSGVSQSWQNLVDMSTFQLATVDRLAELDQDESSLLFGHVDTDRVFVSGHSRGGGASQISLWREPSLLGAICFEQVSPLQTPSQDWSDPEGNGDRAFPVRPMLIFVGSLDLDEAWPLVDVSYEQTVGPTALVTIHGANHEDTYDAGTAGGTTSTSTIPVSARHAIDQHYSTAFLRRFGGAGEAAGDLSWDPLLFGAEALSSDLSDQGVSTHGRRYAARTLVVDDFQEAPEQNLLGGDNLADEVDEDDNDEPYAQGLLAVGRYDERGTRIGQWARARRLSWSSEEAELALWLDPAGEPVDLSAWEAVALRLARDCPSPYSGPCPDLAVDVELALWDADGNEVGLALSDGMGDRGIVGRHWSTARLDLDAFAGVDLSQVEGIALRLSALGWVDGDLWLDDLRLE